ncbi:E3 ubiquitin-protein ligase MYLIP-like [Histomonas meleagridis]|uniref:E3 ubiquitin-protein ligase MYLIP-like n=1 Tax=Histomonas meleagridis TaxID=135588 RepID=UPI003559522D|nr:E3 ubiquitin-protein ligase MYLIP-like [Histomonas meleagridis]KAH0803691.1 E3 ubiquitin-protein ligase MYLIP-like [Histomonas meleagridis]
MQGIQQVPNQNSTVPSSQNQNNAGGYHLVNTNFNLQRPILVQDLLINSINKLPEPLPNVSNPGDLPECQEPFFKEDTMQKLPEEKEKERRIPGMCMKCLREPATNVCIPCGHRIFCANCSAKIPKDRSETCPLCNVHISSAISVFSESNCCVCGTNDCNSIFLPCGHQCCCYSCATKIWKEKNPCPMCRKGVISVKIEYPIYGDGADGELPQPQTVTAPHS